MLNSDGIENNNKKNNFNNNRSNQRKKKQLYTCSTLFFVHFFAFVVAQLQCEAFQFIHFLWRKCCTFSQKKNCCLCSCSLSFALPLIFILLAANIPHFLTTAIKFSCVSNEICLLCFYLSLLFFPCYPCQPSH